MRFVDSHLHLGGAGAPQAVALASTSDILLLTCGVDRETSLAGLGLARGSDSVRAFVGVHPSEVLKEPDFGWLKGALEGASGVGEVGLDPKYSPISEGSPQRRAFRAQLEAAKQSGKPVQVHSRDAAAECIDEVSGSGVRGVLFHWFQDEARLSRVQGSGYYVSFGPSLVYSKRLQRMAAGCSRGLVLTETDSPVTFGPLGGVSGPSLVPTVIFKLAEVWKVPFEEAAWTVSENARSYLGSSEKG